MRSFLFTAILVSLIPNNSFAGFDLMASVGMYSYESSTDTQDTGTTQVELRSGYTFENGVFAGAFYTLGTDKYVEATDNFNLGVMLGYRHESGAYAMYGHTFFGEQDLESGGTKYSSGEGPQVTFGFAVPLMEGVLIAPEFTWRQISYSQVQVTGAPDNTVNREDTTFHPSINFWFEF